MYQVRFIWYFQCSGHFIMSEPGLVDVMDDKLGKRYMSASFNFRIWKTFFFFPKDYCVWMLLFQEGALTHVTNAIFSPTPRNRHSLSMHHFDGQMTSNSVVRYFILYKYELNEYKYGFDDFPEFSVSFLFSIQYFPQYMAICRKNLKMLPNISWHLWHLFCEHLFLANSIPLN